jgi:uncharacterized protein (TIGR00290 family)
MKNIVANSAFFNWSGGKDSALALHKILQLKEFHVHYLLTNVNAAHDRISMHGVRRSLLEAQATSIGIPLQTVELPEQPSMMEYEQSMLHKIQDLKSAGCTKAIFGDIFLEDLKIYREQKLKEVNVECIFPLWKMNSTELVKEFIGAGFKAIIVCVNENYLDKSFCGRLINESFISDLPNNVDVCGEYGEFHSFVFDGPIFKQRIKFSKSEIVHKKYEAPKIADDNNQPKNNTAEYGFYFCDLLPG